MDVTEWVYKEFPGTPPDGESGYFLGYDADLQPYVLKWCNREINDTPGGFWIAISLDEHEHDSAQPIVHALVGGDAGKIVKWAALPLRWSALDRGSASADDVENIDRE